MSRLQVDIFFNMTLEKFKMISCKDLNQYLVKYQQKYLDLYHIYANSSVQIRGVKLKGYHFAWDQQLCICYGCEICESSFSEAGRPKLDCTELNLLEQVTQKKNAMCSFFVLM